MRATALARRGVQRAAPGLVCAEAPSIAALQADWTRLGEETGDIFLTWEWAATWDEIVPDERRLLLTFAAPGEPVRAIVPLAVTRERPVRVVRFVGQEAADQVGPICHPRDRAALAPALRRELTARIGRGGLLVARGLMREDGWAQMPGAVVLHREPSGVLDIDGRGWDGWLATKSPNFRQQIRRRERRLRADHGLAFTRVERADALEPAMRELFRLHDARWQGESEFFTPDARVFHLAFARRGLERGWLRLWHADLDGRAAALQLNYRYGGDEWSFQAARDPAWSDAGIGQALLAHTVRTAFEDGVRRYRFLSGDHGYKRRFADGDAGHESVLLTSPALAPLARIGVEAARRAPKRLREGIGRRARV